MTISWHDDVSYVDIGSAISTGQYWKSNIGYSAKCPSVLSVHH